ncbi:MAG TPA: GIY-YIG nuclease family protein [Pyrinomonadaceae bacterium]|nr:GIY-YIG nuclease family protein [Pyrinomonadaceae bacterium]
MNNKQLKREYKLGLRPMGVFQIRNLVNEKIFVASGIDLKGIINSHRFQLGAGTHRNQALQSDWNKQGQGGFAFEILDQMNPADDPRNSRRDLVSLEGLWLKKLRPYGERGYNERKMDREEILRRMAERRSDEALKRSTTQND